MRILNDNRRAILTVILIAVLFVGLGFPARANAANDEGVGAIQRLIAGYLYEGLVVVNAGIAFVVESLQNALYFRLDTNFPVVQNMWKIVRDFANMLFIVVLIAVAMGTVFNVKSFGFGDLDLGGGFLMQFLIAALLINFSLTIGGLIISGTQVINDTFLSSIGNFQDRLGSVLNPKVLIGLPADADWFVNQRVQLQLYGPALISDLTQGMVVQLFFTLILAVILLFSLLVPTVFVFARIPMLMILLIFAPGAWLLGILPSTRQVSSGWWKQFWGWNLFLPLYLLVLYFGLYFLSYQKTILDSINRTQETNILGFSNLTLGVVFFYFVAAMIFVMGTAMAAQASFLGGTTAGKVAGWARGKVGGWWFGGRAAVYGGRLATGAIAGGIAGGISGYEKGGQKISGVITGALGGAKSGLFSSKQVTEAIKKRGVEFAGELKKEGLPGRAGFLYGGTRKGEQLGAEVAGMLGDKGAIAARLKADVGDFKKKFDEGDYTPEQLRGIIASGGESVQRKLAAYELLKSKKVLSAPEIVEAYNLYQNYSIRNATAFAMDVEYDKLTKGERKQLYTEILKPDKTPNADVRRKLAKVMAQEGEFDSVSDLSEAVSLFEPKSAKREFLKSAAKKKLVESFRVGENLGLLLGKDGISTIKFEEALKEEVARRKGDDKLDLISKDLNYKADSKDQKPLPSDPKEAGRELKNRQVKEGDYQKLNEFLKEDLANPKIRANILRNQKLSREQAQIIENLTKTQVTTPQAGNL